MQYRTDNRLKDLPYDPQNFSDLYKAVGTSNLGLHAAL